MKIYMPLEKELERVVSIHSVPFVTNLDLQYVNTVTAYCLTRILKLLENKMENGNDQITVNWIYDRDDNDNLEVGEDLQGVVPGLRFNLVERIQDKT